MLLAPFFIHLVKVTEWPPFGKTAAHSASEMFLWYKYLIVSLVFSHLGFWSGNLSLIAPFPDLCLLVPFFSSQLRTEFHCASPIPYHVFLSCGMLSLAARLLKKNIL